MAAHISRSDWVSGSGFLAVLGGAGATGALTGATTIRCMVVPDISPEAARFITEAPTTAVVATVAWSGMCNADQLAVLAEVSTVEAPIVEASTVEASTVVVKGAGPLTEIPGRPEDTRSRAARAGLAPAPSVDSVRADKPGVSLREEAQASVAADFTAAAEEERGAVVAGTGRRTLVSGGLLFVRCGGFETRARQDFVLLGS